MVCLYKPMEMPCSAVIGPVHRAVKVVLGRVQATDVFPEWNARWLWEVCQLLSY